MNRIVHLQNTWVCNVAWQTRFYAIWQACFAKTLVPLHKHSMFYANSSKNLEAYRLHGVA